MPDRRTGPPPHTQDPWTRLTSPRGIPVDQLVSVLQKDIRRGNADNAVLAAYEMLTTSPEVAEHMWHRLKVIAVEDIGMGEPLAPVVLNSLHENYRAATGGEQAMMAIHAVRFLATAKKDRTSSEHTDLVVHQVESGQTVVSIPDYALCVHTKAGQEMGRGLSWDFSKRRFASFGSADQHQTEQRRNRRAWWKCSSALRLGVQGAEPPHGAYLCRHGSPAAFGSHAGDAQTRSVSRSHSLPPLCRLPAEPA